jgi:hypothetical protein
MKDITVAFYKGEGLRRDKLVRWWTGSEYSHVELIMPNGDMAGIRPPDDPFVRKKTISGMQTKDWDFVNISVTEKQLSALRSFIESTKGQGYDWVGMIASHLTPFKVRVPNKWYCSEWVAYALSVSKILKWKDIKLYNIPRVPPGRLYTMLRKIGIKYEEN